MQITINPSGHVHIVVHKFRFLWEQHNLMFDKNVKKAASLIRIQGHYIHVMVTYNTDS